MCVHLVRRGGTYKHQFVSTDLPILLWLSAVDPRMHVHHTHTHTLTEDSLQGYRVISSIIHKVHNYKASGWAPVSPLGTSCQAVWEKRCKFKDSPLRRIWMRHLREGKQSQPHFHKRCNFLTPRALKGSICFIGKQNQNTGGVIFLWFLTGGRNNEEELKNHYGAALWEATQTPIFTILPTHTNTNTGWVHFGCSGKLNEIHNQHPIVYVCARLMKHTHTRGYCWWWRSRL